MTVTRATPLDDVDARTITRPLDALLREAAARFPLLACSTPINAASEQERLLAAWSSHVEASPEWTPPTLDHSSLTALRRALEHANLALEAARAPWLVVYRARILECMHELAVVGAAFTDAVGAHARARYPATEHEVHADRLAATWKDARDDDTSDERVQSDDERDPRSLVSQMRRAIGAHGLGVRVVARERIGALAAAGDGIVIVAKNRAITEGEASRVVLHEVEGHVLPRERGRAGPHGLCTLGSAGASEDEEGRALLLEDRAGMLGPRRKRALASRHLAARAVEGGATYVDVVRRLRDEVGLPVDEALAIASRVLRGAYGRGRDVVGGVARERVYLPAFARVSEATRADATLVDRLGNARLSLAARGVLGL